MHHWSRYGLNEVAAFPRRAAGRNLLVIWRNACFVTKHRSMRFYVAQPAVMADVTRFPRILHCAACVLKTAL